MNTTIEIDDKLLAKIDLLALKESKSRYDKLNEILNKGLRKDSHEEAAKRFAESYRLMPETQQEIEEQRDWEEIQDWGDE